ncbi:sulfotransferase family protein [Rubritalea tangerina]|uniref:Sulfotransferase family protein n=1 Tax=Rubritalea tangerina TaxID=430798 RepID=A0ABW4ZB51_9BACT
MKLLIHDFYVGFRAKLYLSHVGKVLRRAILNHRLQANQDVAPCFIVGCGHSGTSLLVSILDEHPKVKALNGENYDFWVWSSPRKIREKFTETFLNINEDAMIPLEKTPKHIHCLDEIFRCYPRAKVIYLHRDPRAVVPSLMNRGSRVSQAINRWIYDNRAIKKYEHDERVCKLSFEQLVKFPKKNIENICNFLGVEFDVATLEHHKTKRDWYGSNVNHRLHAQRRYQQINKAIDASYADKWKSTTSPDLIKKNRAQVLISNVVVGV